MPRHAGKVIPKDYPPENVLYDPTGDYAFLIDDEGSALAMAVGTIAAEYVEPPPPAATGATAGTPGTWTPAGSTPPADTASMGGVTASPTTAWTTGQYVQTQTAGAAGQTHWNGTAWTAGTAP